MKGIGCGWTFGIWATWLRFTPSLAFLFVFCVVAGHHGFVWYTFDEVSQTDAFDVCRIEDGHGFLFGQLHIRLEHQRFIDNLKGVAVLAGNACEKLHIGLLVLGDALDVDFGHRARDR